MSAYFHFVMFWFFTWYDGQSNIPNLRFIGAQRIHVTTTSYCIVMVCFHACISAIKPKRNISPSRGLLLDTNDLCLVRKRSNKIAERLNLINKLHAKPHACTARLSCIALRNTSVIEGRTYVWIWQRAIWSMCDFRTHRRNPVRVWGQQRVPSVSTIFAKHMMSCLSIGLNHALTASWPKCSISAARSGSASGIGLRLHPPFI